MAGQFTEVFAEVVTMTAVMSSGSAGQPIPSTADGGTAMPERRG
jgi:hypothetical protein